MLHKSRNFIVFNLSKTSIMKNRKSLAQLCLLLCLIIAPVTVNSELVINAQQTFPELPSDLTRVYYMGVDNKLVPLPFEQGITSVNAYAIARENKTSAVKLSGANAATYLPNSKPSFYVFVADRMDPPPHLLIRLTGKKSSRQFMITTIKGRKGYLPLNEESISLDYRILERLPVDAGKGRILFVNYMEIHPRQALTPGEYGIIGNSLSDIATFSIK